MTTKISLEKVCRDHFLSYCATVTPTFEANHHHFTISKYLKRIAKKEPIRLIITLPPRHGKTFLISQHFPAWFLGHNPTNNVISTAYNQSLAEDYGKFVKNMMLDDRHQKIFPNVKLDFDTKSKKRFSLNQGGQYFAVGRGGAITGRGGDLLIIDDLIKNDQEARSTVYRQNMIDWYQNTLFTRLMPDASIVIVMTRWHEEDLVGYLLKNSNENWEVINFPAINDKGEALWPERYSLEDLENIKREIGSMAFQGLYQQSPMKQEGNMVKKDWIQYWETLPNQFDREIITIDTTFKGNPESDFNVLQCWGKKSNFKYLRDQIRGKLDFTQLIAQVETMINRYPRATTYIEDSANANAVLSVLQKKFPSIKLWKPTGSKEHRLNAGLPQFERGEVFLSKAYPETVDELMIFPNGKNDDCVDACTMALIILDDKADNSIFSVAY